MRVKPTNLILAASLFILGCSGQIAAMILTFTLAWFMSWVLRPSSFIAVLTIVFRMVLGLLVVTGFVACSMAPSPQLTVLTELPIESVSTDPIAPIFGEVPVIRLGRFLVESGHLTDYPQSSEPIFLDGPADIEELNAQIAFYGYRVVGNRLIQLSAHHGIESPDSLGRPTSGVAFVERRQLNLMIEFWRIGINADIANPAVAASAQIQRFTYRTSPGIEFDFGNTTERSFSEAVVLGSSDAQALEGQTVFREAGLSFTGTVGLVPPFTRVSGDIEVSSFLGSGVERATVDIPVEIDGVLGRWIEIARIDAADVNAGIAFRTLGWNLDAGAERIIVRLRVDPVVSYVSPDKRGSRDGASEKESGQDVPDDRQTSERPNTGSLEVAADNEQRSGEPDDLAGRD